MKFMILFLGLCLISASALAQYRSAPCKAKGLEKETCLVKEDRSSEVFNAQDLEEMKVLVEKYPSEAWKSVIDDGTLVSTLVAQREAIPKTEQNHYDELLLRIKAKYSVRDVLDASIMFLKYNPKQPFYMNSKNPDIVRQVVALPKEAGRCKPDPKKYMAIKQQMDVCIGEANPSMNAINFYSVLAEIAACEKYGIEKIDVEQLYMTRSLTGQACVVSLRDNKIETKGVVSSSIGGGVVNLKIAGQKYPINWDAKHDLSGQQRDLKFWREQLIPQVEEVISGNG